MSDRNTSGYERATLLELRIARSTAWLLWLSSMGMVIVTIIQPFTWAYLFTALILAVCATWSAKCESIAEGKLKTIWEAEQAERMILGVRET